MGQEFKSITCAIEEDILYDLEVNEVAIKVTVHDLETQDEHSYVTRLSFLNRTFFTNFTMGDFVKIIKKVFTSTVTEFVESFVAYFRDKESAHKLSLVLHTLYAYSLDFFPKRSMVLRQSLYQDGEAIIFRLETVDMIDREVYAFTKGFLKVLFETKKELDYEFLVGLIGNLKLAIKFSNYYEIGTTENPEEIQEYLNNYINE